MIAASSEDIRVSATEEALQPGLIGVAEMAEAKNVLNRLQHGIMVEGNVGHRSGLEDFRDQHSADAIATEALRADEEAGRSTVGILKPEDQRLAVCHQRPDVRSGLLAAAAYAWCRNRVVCAAVDRSQRADVTLVESDDQKTVLLESGRVHDHWNDLTQKGVRRDQPARLPVLAYLVRRITPVMPVMAEIG